MKTNWQISIRILLFTTAIAAAFAAGYSFRPRSRVLTPQTIVIETWADFEVGDLVPCAHNIAEYTLEIRALNGGDEKHYWQECFCHYDGSNTDPTRSELMNGVHCCATGTKTSFSGGITVESLSPDSMGLLIDWQITETGKSTKFSTKLMAQPNSSGEIQLDSSKTIRWTMKPTGRNDAG